MYIAFFICVAVIFIRRKTQNPVVTNAALVVISIIELIYFWILEAYYPPYSFFKTIIYLFTIAFVLIYQVKLTWSVFRSLRGGQSRILVCILSCMALTPTIPYVIGDIISLAILSIPIIIILTAVAKSDSSEKKPKAQWEIDSENESRARQEESENPKVIYNQHGTFERQHDGRYKKEGEWGSPSIDKSDIN